MKENNSFKKGWGQVTIGKMEDVKAELWKVLNIVDKQQWHRRLNNKKHIRPLNLAEIIAVERVFKKYGIVEVWGES